MVWQFLAHLLDTLYCSFPFEVFERESIELRDDCLGKSSWLLGEPIECKPAEAVRLESIEPERRSLLLSRSM